MMEEQVGVSSVGWFTPRLGQDKGTVSARLPKQTTANLAFLLLRALGFQEKPKIFQGGLSSTKSLVLPEAPRTLGSPDPTVPMSSTGSQAAGMFSFWNQIRLLLTLLPLTLPGEDEGLAGAGSSGDRGTGMAQSTASASATSSLLPWEIKQTAREKSQGFLLSSLNRNWRGKARVCGLRLLGLWKTMWEYSRSY